MKKLKLFHQKIYWFWLRFLYEIYLQIYILKQKLGSFSSFLHDNISSWGTAVVNLACITLKGVFAKNERLTVKNRHFWSLLILLLSVASLRRKLVKTTHSKEQIQKVSRFSSDRKKINFLRTLELLEAEVS